MCKWTLAQAKRDYALGYLSGWVIRRQGDEGWTVELHSTSGLTGPLVDARSREPRVFRSFNAVLSSLESIGFEVTELHPAQSK